MFLKTLTELEAVNSMLDILGEMPVNTLDGVHLSEASLARDTLNHVSRTVQSQGLQCNKDNAMVFYPDAEGEIHIPLNVLALDASDTSLEYVQRGQRLYDRTNHAYTFTEPVELDIVSLLPFEELPHVVREYITIKSARIFCTRKLGSDLIVGLTEKEEYEALVTMRDAELNVGDYNIFDSGDFISQSVYRRSP